MTFNGAEDNYRETNIKRSFIIWFNILRSRETKLHWFILSSINVYDSLQSSRFLTETQRQDLSQGWLRGTLITSPFKSVFDSPQRSSSFNDQDGGIALSLKKTWIALQNTPTLQAMYAIVYRKLPLQPAPSAICAPPVINPSIFKQKHTFDYKPHRI